jgi:hypothetical protein
MDHGGFVLAVCMPNALGMSRSTCTTAEKRHQRRPYAVPAAFLIHRSSIRLWSVITILANIAIKTPRPTPHYLPAITSLLSALGHPWCRDVPLVTRATCEYGHPRLARTGGELVRGACTCAPQGRAHWLPPSTGCVVTLGIYHIWTRVLGSKLPEATALAATGCSNWLIGFELPGTARNWEARA